MVSLKSGDRVVIKLKESRIIEPYNPDYDETKILEIIAHDSSGYYLFVPHYIFIHDTKKIDRFLCKELNFNSKYIGDDIIYIEEKKVYKVFSILNGMPCAQCGEFYDYAVSNQDDGSLICWACKNHE